MDNRVRVNVGQLQEVNEMFSKIAVARIQTHMAEENSLEKMALGRQIIRANNTGIPYKKLTRAIKNIVLSQRLDALYEGGK